MGVSFAGKAATEKEYTLKCRVKRLEAGFRDSRGRQLTSTMVLLLPEMANTETIRFLCAWQPLAEEEPGKPQHFELTGYITTAGIHSASRFAILAASPMNPSQPFLTVMSVGVKKLLESMDKRTIEVIILPESEDEIGDEAISE